jgi:hypothetical protein
MEKTEGWQMRLKGEWEGIPGHWLRDSQSPDGQRFIATHYGWERIRDRVKELDNAS